MTADETQLKPIEARLAAASGESWELARDAGGHAVITARFVDGRERLVRVMRESEPASDGDVEFIAFARRDIAQLVSAVREGSRVAAAEVATIKARAGGASPGPWKAFLKSAGGLGGESVIWVSDADDEPDMYLRLEDEPAPDADFAFVAAAREDIPALLELLEAEGAS
jgi:hypothetical protein